MASSTKNVKLGVCQVFFGGADLGYTQGGVEVTVTTETHKVNIDQFGNTTINEYIMGRECKAAVPMAETTLQNLVAVMPGATLSITGGTPATGSITIATNPSAGDTIVVNGVTVTFRTTLTGSGVEVLIGGTAAATATALAAALTASSASSLEFATYTASSTAVNISTTYYGNNFTLATGTAGAKVTVSAATLSGGVDPTGVSVSVPTGVGNNLLDFAQELRIHPVGKALSDKSEDFVIPLAATAGALSFAYKLDQERIYNVEFMGYPDGTGKLFTIGV